MDNLAHTLVGAALGRAVAGHRVPRAALLGAVAANAPDWTELLLTPPRSGAAYLVEHRGITHSLLGAGVEIAALTALLAIASVFWSRSRGGGPGEAGSATRPAAPWRWIAACVAATVLSHLYMDWQGSYGLRPLLPWSGRWYYADWVAIVDPFFWLAPLLALAWGARRHWVPGLLAAVVGLPTAVVVLWSGGGGPAGAVALWVKLGFGVLCVVGLVGWTRHWFGVAGGRRAAALAVLSLAAYALAHGVASIGATRHARRQARERFGAAAEWAALTVVGRPFTWEAIAAGRDTVAGRDWALPRHLDDPVVQRALRETTEGRAMAQFARFLAAEVDSSAGVRVYLRDARFTRTAREGWGVLAVRLRD